MKILLAGLAGLGLLVVLFLGWSNLGPRRFTDADQDGEPDETPEEKRRALDDEGR
ncbi:hypothetical protein [Brevundimonas faecalis]|uniref:Uncharacterized protein n=1 Tax=Brevundimonas faecalis TaxID=947378 RepID=A0ABV2RD13_9CAUL